MAILIEKDNVVYIGDTLYAPIKYLYVNLSRMIQDRIINNSGRGFCGYRNDDFGSSYEGDYRLFKGGGSKVEQVPLITLQDFEKHFDNGYTDKINRCYNRKAYAERLGLKLKSLELFAYEFGNQLW
jgi:hypothetical protein